MKINHLILLLAISGQPALAGLRLQYSEDVSPEHRRLLNQDLLRLGSLNLKGEDGELKRILKISTLTGPALMAWLEPRVHFIVDQDHPVDETVIQTLQEDVSFPQGTGPLAMPFQVRLRQAPAPEAPAPEVKEDEQDPDPRGHVVMSNLGGYLYQYSKMNRSLVAFHIRGLGPQEINSPRVGLLQIGQALFEPLNPNFTLADVRNRLHSLVRISTLLHEARHSDGHGKSLVFAHVECPPRHDYEGLMVCDRPANGAYRIEALFLREAAASCRNCTVAEKEQMNLLRLEAESKVLSPTFRGEVKARRPLTPSEQDLCASLWKQKIEPNFCRESNPQAPVIEWDDAPESL